MAMTKSNPYTPKDVADGKRFLAAETRCLGVAKAADIKAMEWAFRFGKILWIDVLKTKRGKRNDGTLKNYLKEVGFDKDASQAYRYIALFRAAKNLATIRTSGLSRAYLTRIGQALWTNEPLLDSWAERLLVNPIRRATETETLKALDEVCSAVELARKRIQRRKSLKVVSSEGRDGGQYVAVQGEEDEMREWLNIQVELEQNVARLTKEHDKVLTVCDPGGTYGVKTPSDMGKEHSAKGLNLDAMRKEQIREILASATKETIDTVDANLILGDSLVVLKDAALFPERAVDCVLTDPPYGDEAYEPEREHTRVKHASPAKVTDAAHLAANVLGLLLAKNVNRPRFCWMQFCPMRYIHVCLPPLLEAFAKHGLSPKTQVLIWDKCVPARVGGGETFGSQAEAILHLNVGRPLPIENADGGKIFSPIFRVPQTKRGKEMDPWKPVELLEQILWLALYGSEKSSEAAKQRVLDPFAGRGTTGIAAAKLGRLYTLIEIDKNQHEIARANLLESLKYPLSP